MFCFCFIGGGLKKLYLSGLFCMRIASLPSNQRSCSSFLSTLHSIFKDGNICRINNRVCNFYCILQIWTKIDGCPPLIDCLAFVILTEMSLNLLKTATNQHTHLTNMLLMGLYVRVKVLGKWLVLCNILMPSHVACQQFEKKKVVNDESRPLLVSLYRLAWG